MPTIQPASSVGGNLGATRKSTTPGAIATARWRRRKAKGSFIVPVEIFDSEVEALVQLGFLGIADARRRRRIGRAVADLVERVLERAARSGRSA